jgi:hypothetical protein
MNAKRTGQVTAVAQQSLRGGEVIEFVTVGKVGTPSKKKQAMVLILSTILTLGMVHVFVIARPYYLVLTSERLLMFPVIRGSGKPGAKPARELRREGLTATRPRSRLGITFYLSYPQTPESRLRLLFAQPQRTDARTLAGALGGVAA